MAGVVGLTCAVCEQVVGVINEEALAKMLGAEEIYICRQCEARDGDDIETVLSGQEPDRYAHLVSRGLLDLLLAQEPLSINVYG
jgi:uncharacterized protein YlaI